MLSRWIRIAPPLLCVVFAALCIWSLTAGEYSAALLQLVFTAFWLLATFRSRQAATEGRRHGT